MRDDERITQTVTIGQRDEKIVAVSAKSESDYKHLGLSLKDLTPDLAARFNLEGEKGILIVDVVPGSAAARAGIRPGAIIREVNREEVATTADFREGLEGRDESQAVLLLIQENDTTRYVALRFDS